MSFTYFKALHICATRVCFLIIIIVIFCDFIGAGLLKTFDTHTHIYENITVM